MSCMAIYLSAYCLTRQIQRNYDVHARRVNAKHTHMAMECNDYRFNNISLRATQKRRSLPTGHETQYHVMLMHAKQCRCLDVTAYACMQHVYAIGMECILVPFQSRSNQHAARPVLNEAFRCGGTDSGNYLED